MVYATIYGEKTIRTVTNATHQDGLEFLDLASKLPIKPKVQEYALESINAALIDLKYSKIDGEAVILVS